MGNYIDRAIGSLRKPVRVFPITFGSEYFLVGDVASFFIQNRILSGKYYNHGLVLYIDLYFMLIKCQGLVIGENSSPSRRR